MAGRLAGVADLQDSRARRTGGLVKRLCAWLRELRIVWTTGYWAGRAAAFSTARMECGRTMDALIDKNMTLESKNAKLEGEVQEWIFQEGRRQGEVLKLRAVLQMRNCAGGFMHDAY